MIPREWQADGPDRLEKRYLLPGPAADDELYGALAREGVEDARDYLLAAPSNPLHRPLGEIQEVHRLVFARLWTPGVVGRFREAGDGPVVVLGRLGAQPGRIGPELSETQSHCLKNRFKKRLSIY